MASELHHFKAQELLSQIDLAKQQRDSNDGSRNALLDAEDHLLQLFEQLYTRKMHTDAMAAFGDARAKLGAYESDLNCSYTTSRLTAARFASDCQLEATSEQLVGEDAVCSLRAVDIAARRLDRLTGSAAANPALAAVRAFIAPSLQALVKAGRLVEASKIESDLWVPVVEPVLDAIEELAKCKPIAEPLSEIVAEIEKLEAVNGETQRAQQDAAIGGDVARNEELTAERVTILEGIADLVTHKFRIINSIGDGTLRVLQRETTRIRKVTTRSAEELLLTTAGKRRTLVADTQRIKDQLSKASHDEQLARSAFLEEKGASDGFLEKNEKQQAASWKEMLRIEAELVRLATERRDEVDRRTRTIEREERRRCNMGHFEAFSAGHLALLGNSLQSCEAEEELGRIMQEVVLSACTAVNTTVSHMQEELDKTQLNAYHEHADRFRDQYLNLGELLYKKERLVEELDRKIAMCNMQQDIAMQTFDPKARVLSQQRGMIELEKAQVQRFIAVLQGKADLYVESFKPTEKALSGLSQSFTHPVALLQDINKKRSRKLDEYYATLVLEENAAQMAKRNGVGKSIVQSAYDAEQEREDIERCRMLNATAGLRAAERRKAAEGAGGVQATTAEQQSVAAWRRRSTMLSAAAAGSTRKARTIRSVIGALPSSHVEDQIDGGASSRSTAVRFAGDGGASGGDDSSSEAEGTAPAVPVAADDDSMTEAAQAAVVLQRAKAKRAAQPSLGLCDALEPAGGRALRGLDEATSGLD
jgi:hypothetical protein